MRGSAFRNKHHNAFRDPSEDLASMEAVNWRVREEWQVMGSGRPLNDVAQQCWLDSYVVLMPSDVKARMDWCREHRLPYP